jgi:GTP-binding protein EngB required for normal cell division
MASDMNTTALGLRPASEPDRNIVLVGRTGNGKSSTGNSLLGEKMFLAKRQAAGVTLRCEMRTAAIQDGSIINVIDTPVSADFLSREITKCLDMAEEGLHAVLFVLSARTRISQEDESTINALQVIFGSKMFDYMIVVFTGGDELKEDNSTLEEYLSEGCPEFLKFSECVTAERLCLITRLRIKSRRTSKFRSFWPTSKQFTGILKGSRLRDEADSNQAQKKVFSKHQHAVELCNILR